MKETSHLFHISYEKYPKLFEILKVDYEFCCSTLKQYLKIYKKIQTHHKWIYPFHTIKGQYLEMRTAGSKDKQTGNYKPIKIHQQNMILCNKPICFMLRTNFLRDVGILKKFN